MPEIPKTSLIFDLPIHLMNDYSDWLASELLQGKGAHVVTLNAEMTMQAKANAALAKLISQAELVIPDGAGITFYFWLHGLAVRRCPGIELSELLLTRSAHPDNGWSVFFYGGSPGVAETAAKSWQAKYPSLRVVGYAHGYLSEPEQQNLRETLKTLQPQIILVGMGVPRQEFWIAEQRSLCPNSIWVGVGGSLDIWAGTKSRAPRWLRDNHLEWTYRLYKEPWRWRRMMALPHFALQSLVYRLTQKDAVMKEQV